jgi:hypothetical protein
MSSEAGAQLPSLRSPLMVEFYSRAFERPENAKTKTEFERGFDRRDAVAGFRINRSFGQDDRDHALDQSSAKSSERVLPRQIKEENDANTASS